MDVNSLPAGTDKLDLLASLAINIRYVSPASLVAFGRKARTHSADQISKIADSIRTFGFAVPIIIDEDDKVIAGNARIEAAIKLGMAIVPVVTLSHLSASQKRAFALAENKIASLAGWNTAVLRLEFQELLEIDLDFSLEVTGFVEPQIDALVFGKDAPAAGDEIPKLTGAATSQLGDLWELGRHRLLCGDSTDQATVARLLAGEKARVAFEDFPYNVRVAGHVTSSKRFSEFAMASGEMSDEEFTTFLERAFARTVESLVPGGLIYGCMDFRHMRHILDGAERNGLELLNLIVWDKQTGGMGSFYRSRHELIFLFSVPGAPHLNRVQLGKHGRDRCNVWTYPGVNGFGAEKAREREMHPTVKPLAMVRDALLDSTKRGDAVLDLFSGSGTTLIAAEESGRRGYAMDLDPRYIDTAIQRWQDFCGGEAQLVGSGKTFREVRAERASAAAARVMLTPAVTSPPHARVRTRTAA